MITLTDNAGKKAFAFGFRTDPYDVLALVAWAYHDGKPVCQPWPGWGCPSTGGQYCLDCHVTGSEALENARSLR